MSFYVYETTAEKKGEVGMTEKVKLTRVQAETIEVRKLNVGREHFLTYHIAVHHDRESYTGINQCLADITLEDIARVLYEPNSYEVEPNYNVGDWVFSNEDNIGLIKGHEKGCYTGLWFGNKKEYMMNCTFYSFKRHATPEEIKAEKERQLWAKIGRDVGEMRIGDAYEHLNGPIYPIDHEERIRKVKKMMDLGYIKGFYPAESFISFEESDEK